jgi:F0F1-type ATP synthase epsilon subunit
MRARIVIGVVGVVGVAIFLACGGVPSQPGNSAASGASSGDASGNEAAKAPTVHKMSETVSVGYTSYKVWRVWWSNQLSENQFLNQRPNASFLFVELTIRNDDTKARSIPPLRLRDENDAEYEASPHGWAVEGSIGVLDSLNPSVSKQGFAVFDVPRGHKYRLEVSGGYWSGDTTFIELADAAQVQQQQVEERAAQQRAEKEAKQAAEQARREAMEKAKWRTWVSANGKFKTHAKFVKQIGGVVTLEKESGKTVDLKMDQLSAADQEFVKKRGWESPP